MASYSTILNLYSQFGEKSYDIFRKSLRNFQHGEFGILTREYEREEAQIRNRVAFLKSAGFLEGTDLTPKGKIAAAVNGYEIQAAELYWTRSFDDCTPAQIAVLLAAMVTEDSLSRRRKGAVADVRMSFSGQKVIHKLRASEIRHNISSPIRELDMALAAPVFAWASGCSFPDLMEFGIPEGDIVRLLRMTVQLLRTLRDVLEDPLIAGRMQEALELVNRSVIDASLELQVG
jgi:superfamily II RNA helicase